MLMSGSNANSMMSTATHMCIHSLGHDMSYLYAKELVNELQRRGRLTGTQCRK